MKMKDGINFDQRDIVLIPFPYSNLLTSKKMPVLIISNSKYNQSNEDIICCALTSSKKFFHKGILITNKDLELGKLNIEKTKDVIKNLNYFIEVE